MVRFQIAFASKAHLAAPLGVVGAAEQQLEAFGAIGAWGLQYGDRLFQQLPLGRCILGGLAAIDAVERRRQFENLAASQKVFGIDDLLGRAFSAGSCRCRHGSDLEGKDWQGESKPLAMDA